jgi:hypothetical protein
VKLNNLKSPLRLLSLPMHLVRPAANGAIGFESRYIVSDWTRTFKPANQICVMWLSLSAIMLVVVPLSCWPPR